MHTNVQSSASARVLFLAVSALLAGFLNGLLGTGGGIILIFALTRLLAPERAKEVFVLSSFGVLAFSAVSAFLYGKSGALDSAALPRFAIPAIIGGVIGAFLIDRIRTLWLRRIFAALLLYSGLKLTGVLN